MRGGADLVLELPLPWALSSAEGFARGAVGLLGSLGVVTHLSFGSECGDLAALQRVAAALESPALPAELTPRLEAGLPFAAARQAAVHALIRQDAALLSSPNNILGIEYLRALSRTGAGITPLTLPRQGAPHDDHAPEADYPSASFLRQQFLSGVDISPQLPPAMAGQLRLAEAQGALPDRALWDRALLARLRTMGEPDFAALPDISEGLENRLYRASRTAKSPEALLADAKTKRYSHARLRRVLLAAMLGLPAGLSAAAPPYRRGLGVPPRGAAGRAAAPAPRPPARAPRRGGRGPPNATHPHPPPPAGGGGGGCVGRGFF